MKAKLTNAYHINKCCSYFFNLFLLFLKNNAIMLKNKDFNQKKE